MALLLAVARLLDRLADRRLSRSIALGATEVGIALLAAYGAVLVVHGARDGLLPHGLLPAVALLVSAKVVVGFFAGAFGTRWRYLGMRDALVVVRASLLAGVAGLAGVASLSYAGYSIRLVVADTILYLLLSCGMRLSARWLHEWQRRTRAVTGTNLRRAVIVGAGEAGTLLVERVLASPRMLIDPAALVDDNVRLSGSRLHGVPVVGPVADLPAIAERFRAEEIIIAIPSAKSEQMARIIDACVATKLPFRIAPDPEDVLGVGAGASWLREVQPGDLLGRAQAEFDIATVGGELRGARVVITGAAGSIGAELARQLIKLEPEALYLVDRNENDLFYLCEEFQRHQVQVAHHPVIEDVRDEARLSRLMGRVQPTHVFHAAAFKHVPLMESHAVAAVDNNILGTWSILRAARATGVRKFVLISSDKAVLPSNVMGGTKRFAEVLVAEGTRDSAMDGIIVRFGNVLGTNGSVVPLFQRQISEGGPVTVTSRKATRYFMTPAEAAQLVLQAAAMPECAGQVAILDMGTPVRIWDLAQRMISMSGLRPGADIAIVETGLRPGEKLHEDLWSESQTAIPSRNPKIMLADAGCLTQPAIPLIPVIRLLVERGDASALVDLLARSVGLASPAAVPDRRTPAPKAAARRPASAPAVGVTVAS